MNISTSPVVVRVSLNGETVETTETEWQEAADALFRKHGGGIPSVVRVGAPEPEAPAPAPAPFSRQASPGLTLVRGSTVVESGKARSEHDLAMARAAGFAPAATLYERGTAVVDVGVENARKSRQEFEDMPLTSEACASLIDRIRAEDREDVTSAFGKLRMGADGRIEGVVDGVALSMTEKAFLGMLTRMGIGGAGYLVKCWPELRAHNVNAWLEKLDAGRESLFRTRQDGVGGREAFATVSPSYAAFDADKIADAIRDALPEGARGRVSYDGERSRIEVLFQSTVQPEDFVAGEFFRAGVIISTDDTGGGSLRGSASVWQNLCLNLIIVDRAEAGGFAIRHTASKVEMADRFRKGFADASLAIENFRKAWGYAVHDQVLESAVNVSGESMPVDKEAWMEWLFRGTIEREMVPVLAGGARIEETVSGLMEAWRADNSAARGYTRAAVVNAVTRYAHQGARLDPWQEDQIQRAAGQLVYSRRPLVLVPPTEKG